MRLVLRIVPGRKVRLLAVLCALAVLSAADASSGESRFARFLARVWPVPVVHFTVNNHWTEQDLADLGIKRLLNNPQYEGGPGCTGKPETEANCDRVYETGQIVPYTTRLTEYRKRRAECQAVYDGPERYSNGDRKCYPRPTRVKSVHGQKVFDGYIEGRCNEIFHPTLAQIRYGRYCGAGYPELSVWMDNRGGFETPIDGVDYCCRLHDANAWNIETNATGHKNVCGFVMCVSMATGYPADVFEQFPDARAAAQCIYDRASSWVAACDPDPDLVPAPLFAPLPAPPQTRLRRSDGTAIQPVP